MEAIGAIGDLGDALIQLASFRAADCVETLSAGRTSLGGNIELAMAPVRRHLAPARVGIILGADGGQQHLERCHAERQTQRAISIVGIEPVVAGAQMEPGRRQDAFVAGATDLKKDQALIFELNLLVVETPRQQHDAVGTDQICARQAVPGLFAG